MSRQLERQNVDEIDSSSKADAFYVFGLLIPFCLQAVEESLKSVNLFHGGVADKQAGKYSGGMKRRLSVAISLIGDPKVC